MTVFDILKMMVETLFPKEYTFYIGGTLAFILIFDLLLNKYGNQKSSSNSSSEEPKGFS